MTRLNNFEEIIGYLEKVDCKENCLILSFNIKKIVEIPSALGIEEKLRKMIGEKIGILHLDGEYHIRQIPEVDKKLTERRVSKGP